MAPEGCRARGLFNPWNGEACCTTHKDMWQAVEWSQKAAEQGGANAPSNLGCCCRNGSVEDYASHSLAQLKDACRAKGLPVGGTKAVLRARLKAAAAPPPQ